MVLLYLPYRRVWNVLRADMALPPCNNRHQRNLCRIIACRDTIVRLPFLPSLNSHISRGHLKASRTLVLLNLRSRGILYRLSIKLAHHLCRCPPPTRVGCPACLHKISNNMLVLHYSKHGNKARRKPYLLHHSRSHHHHLI